MGPPRTTGGIISAKSNGAFDAGIQADGGQNLSQSQNGDITGIFIDFHSEIIEIHMIDHRNPYGKSISWWQMVMS